MPGQPETAHPAHSDGRKRVLIVDDVENNIRVVEAMLESFDLEIDVASSGAEAVSKAETCRPDIVVMDIAMPYMTGFEATDLINNIYREDPVDVIALSADVTPENISKMKQGPFKAFLRKPVNVMEFQSIMTQLVDAS